MKAGGKRWCQRSGQRPGHGDQYDMEGLWLVSEWAGRSLQRFWAGEGLCYIFKGTLRLLCGKWTEGRHRRMQRDWSAAYSPNPGEGWWCLRLSHLAVKMMKKVHSRYNLEVALIGIAGALRGGVWKRGLSHQASDSPLYWDWGASWEDGLWGGAGQSYTPNQRFPIHFAFY